MLIRLLDVSDQPLWINARHVRTVRPVDPQQTCLRVDDADVVVKGAAHDIATQLQDALVGRKYVDFWSH